MSWSLVLAILLAPMAAEACKDRRYPPSAPIEEFAQYDHVYVVEIGKVTFIPGDPEPYIPPFTFQSRIMRAFKGPLQPGQVITAVTGASKIQGGCSIRLEEGKTYLLMLNGAQSPYVLPRHGSLYLSSDSPRFQGYVADLTAAAAAGRLGP